MGLKLGQERPKEVKWVQLKVIRVKWGPVGNIVRVIVFGWLGDWLGG